MKKLTLALSFACAGALAFADSEQWQSPWFTGIGSTASSITSLASDGGSWDGLTTDSAEVSAGALVLDLDDGDEAEFSVTTAATDEKTAQKISVTGVFTPIASADLPSSTDMGSGDSNKNAQLGFAVVSTTTTSENDSSTTTTTYTYQAWVGGDWVSLGTCADKDAQTALTVTFAYWDSSVTATFAIKNGDTDVTFDNSDATTKTLSLSGNALTVAQANYKVSSVACTGSGTLSALTGDAQYAVATVGDRNYGTVADAITAATATGASDTTVKLVKKPDGEVTIESGTVKIDDNGIEANIVNNGTMNIEVKDTSTGAVAGSVPSGIYEIPVNATGSGTITATIDDASKEMASSKVENGKLYITVQTAKSVLQGITFNGQTLMTSETKLREFLAANCKTSYEQAKTTSDAIQTALAEQATISGDTKNDLTKWQCYALGISPTTTLKTDYSTSDSGSENITIKIAPSVNTESILSSGDFTINYVVADSSGNTKTTTAASSDAAITVPMTETGRYSVNVVFSAPTTSTSTDNANE